MGRILIVEFSDTESPVFEEIMQLLHRSSGFSELSVVDTSILSVSGLEIIKYIKEYGAVTPMEEFNNRVSRLLYRCDYNGSLIFLQVRQSLYYVRPNLDINSVLSTLILVLPHIYMQILCVGILLLYQFLFLYLLCIWNKRKRLI